MANSTETNASLSNLTEIERGSSYKTVEVIFIVIVAGSLSLVTIIGNILVMVSIKVNRQLQTINNYFIFSLACADLIIGVFSMNLYTIYIVIGYWPMGPVVCDLWLALDYVVSNASVMNLLIISFDRYFCVTKPLSYPVKRTTKMAGMMIAAAWVLSFILWAPAILFWQFIVGGRTVNEGECHVQFFSNPVVTFGTAIAAFYLPVIIMTILYVHISRASKSRIKKDKKEPESNKGTVSPSLVRGKIMKPNNNNISSAPDGLQDVKVQNGKAAGEIMTDNCGQGEEKEVSNDSTSLSVVPSIQKEEGVIEESTKVSTTQSRFRIDSSKLSCIKVVTKSQKSDYCATTVEIVPGNSNKNGKDREITAAHKIIKMTKTPAKKKKGAVTREKKVTRTILAILLAFIVTWTPYNVMVLINTFCSVCVPNTVWTIGYWLCYINSTINPACYALCNTTFKKTFKHLLLCQYKNIGATR
ncbi:muscarinic acetylcholine receptor M2-like [Pristis pectinata]|uniref:muscarinic acetylcholine receptor M2-like n=1 Tax=Pristis pectinata TaxID=685728 RepID=UPI00223C92AA|nr:muscarinic acetylcholine receptor M2-like [Pristis pectinata]